MMPKLSRALQSVTLWNGALRRRPQRTARNINAASASTPIDTGPSASVSSIPSPSSAQTPAYPAFEPYARSLSRSWVGWMMAPVMGLAKLALTLLLRLRGAKSMLCKTASGHVAIWDIRGRGTGPTVVLVHGLGGSSAEYVPILAALRARCARVVMVDLPGHGLSPALGTHTPVGFGGVHQVSEQARKAVGEALHRHLGDMPAHFIGHSLGGFFAAHLVHDRRARGVASQLLLGESDGAPWSDARLIDDRRDFAVGTHAAAWRVARANYPARLRLARLCTPFLWARLASPAMQYLTHSDLKQPVLPPSLLRDLPERTMVIVGKQDKFGAPEDVAYFRDHLPGTASIYHPDTGHLDIVDAHPEALEVLDAFLRVPS